LASILVPIIVGPLFIAILIYVIIKIKRKRDKGKIKTDILDDEILPKGKVETGKKPPNVKAKETKEVDDGIEDEEEDDDDEEKIA
jgi:hypothetical protein